jgi:hypothetical protein
LTMTPPLLLFPALTWLYNKLFCCCRSETLQEEFMRCKLPSVERAKLEEEALDQYLIDNNITIAQ